MSAVEVLDPTRWHGDHQRLVGQTMEGWRRRGKYLIGDLSSDCSVVSHLGMTGQWVIGSLRERRHQRVRVSFHGARAPECVVLVDPRRFGCQWVWPTSRLPEHPRLVGLGRDPLLSPVDGEWLRETLGRSSSILRRRLMEQSLISGLGNIAVSEIAWRAAVHPHRRCLSLDAGDWSRIAEATHAYIRDTLAVEEASPTDEVVYLSVAGAHNPFHVYGREGEGCPRCEGILIRESMGGRPSFFCDDCQASPAAALPRS